MKTNIKSLLLSIVSLAVFSFIFTSCDDDGDTTPPVINLIEPEDGDVLKIGSDIHFDMELSDNETLKSYKVEIHENMSKPHDHGNSLKSGSDTEYFSYQNTWLDIEGLRNTSVHHHQIVIPENATPGAYHMVVYCFDSAGNESHVAINIELSHDGEVHEH
ncbi:MAG: DUF4625 domain-containing protein [Tannerella sp.]|jgi:hypothetical protein|nr:DUF4625 domain-containing protein [Tannerella sp.]